MDERPYWPPGEFHPRIPNSLSLLVAALVGIGFWLLVHNLRWIACNTGRLVFVDVFLVLGTNLLQGFHAGFTNPSSARPAATASSTTTAP